MHRILLKKVVVMMALGVMAAGNASAVVTAKLGQPMPDAHPMAIAMNKFVELAAKYTNNNVKIQPFHNAVLGSDEKMLQSVQAGTLEFYIGTLAPLSTRIKEVQVWDLPFMFASKKEVYAVLDGQSGKKIFEKLEPTGMVGLTWSAMGFRNLSNSKRAVTKLDDITGLCTHDRQNVALHVFAVPGIQFSTGMAGQRGQLEVEEFVNIQRAGLVV